MITFRIVDTIRSNRMGGFAGEINMTGEGCCFLLDVLEVALHCCFILDGDHGRL